MESTPIASIGLPVFNGQRHLEGALDSILAQTIDDFELVISDNGSTDRTEEICRTYAAQDRRIRYFRQQLNCGAAFNYNFVFQQSKAPFFKWATHDDLLSEEFLQRCIQPLMEDPDIVLAYSLTKLIDEWGQPISMAEEELNLDSPDIVTRFHDALSPMKLCHNPVFGVIRSDVLAKTRLIGSYLASDRCLVAELTLYGRFYEVPERLFIRRRHANSIGTGKHHLKFYDPSVSARFVLPEHRVLREHLVSIQRAPLTLAQRKQLVSAVIRWGFSKRPRFRNELENALTDIMSLWLPSSVIARMKRFKHPYNHRAATKGSDTTPPRR